MTRVLLVGETDSFGLTGSYLRAFRALDCQTEVFDWVGSFRSRLPGPLQRLRTPLQRPGVQRALLREVRRFAPDLLFFLKCDDIAPSVYAGIAAMRPRPIMAAFHPDDPFNVRGPWGSAPSHSRALAQARAMDAYFLWSRPLLARLEGSKAHYLAFGADPSLHHPVTVTEAERQALASDVSFVGNWDPRREAWLAPLEQSGLSLAIWGTEYWRTRCRSPYLVSCWRGRPALAEEFCKVVEASKVSLNLLRAQNLGGHNMRTFEIPACGGAMLAEWSDDQAIHFRPGDEAEYATTPQEMAAKARELVLSPGRLAALRARALERSRASTYVARAGEVLGVALGVR